MIEQFNLTYPRSIECTFCGTSVPLEWQTEYITKDRLFRDWHSKDAEGIMKKKYYRESKQFTRRGSRVTCKYCGMFMSGEGINRDDRTILRRSREFKRRHRNTCTEKTRMIREL